MTLERPLPTEFDYRGTLIKLNMAFNNVLSYYKLNSDDDFDYEEKVVIAFNLLCKVDSKAEKRLSVSDKANILTVVNKEFLKANDRPRGSNTQKVFDFEQDGDLIYASFMKEYGIDLYDQVDKLDFRKFIWLLHGLGSDTKLQKVIDIRLKPIPTRNKDNGEYIKELLEAKTIYALEMKQEEREKQFADSLKIFAKRMIDMGRNCQNEKDNPKQRR